MKIFRYRYQSSCTPVVTPDRKCSLEICVIALHASYLPLVYLHIVLVVHENDLI